MEADGPSIGEVMDQWTTRKGFPVIKVYPDPESENDDILIEQVYKPHREAWQVPLRLLDGDHHTSILLGGEQPHRQGYILCISIIIFEINHFTSEQKPKTYVFDALTTVFDAISSSVLA